MHGLKENMSRIILWNISDKVEMKTTKLKEGLSDIIINLLIKSKIKKERVVAYFNEAWSFLYLKLKL